MSRVAAGASTVLLAAVIGCSSTDVGSVRQDPHATLQVWIRQTPGSAAADTEARLVAAFSKATGYNAKAIALYDDFETKLEQQAAQRQLPDIVINDTAQVGFMQSQGWLEQIGRSTFPNTADLSDRAWKATQAANGNYYGVPFSAHTFAFFIRSDWRKKLGLPLPKTWQDLVNMAVAFTTQDPDGDAKADTYGLDIPGTTKRGYMAWYFTTPLLDNGGDFLQQSQPGRWVPEINSAKSVQAAQWLQQMFCQYKVVNPDAVTIDTPAAHDRFEKGALGMYLTGPYMLPRFLKSMGGAELDVVPMPAGPGGGPSALAEGENVYLTRGSPNEAGQMAFAEFATSIEGQSIGMDGDDAGPIVRRGRRVALAPLPPRNTPGTASCLQHPGHSRGAARAAHFHRGLPADQRGTQRLHRGAHDADLQARSGAGQVGRSRGGVDGPVHRDRAADRGRQRLARSGVPMNDQSGASR
jgi:multiple sugar transport system substrate-binding protein